VPVTTSDALARLCACDAASPGMVLAVGPGAARHWRAALADAGGAFASVASIETLVTSAEEHALLPAVRDVDPAERVAIVADVLRCHPEVERSLAADPQRLAAVVLGLCDELALHGFHRVAAAKVATVGGPAVVRSRIALLHAVLLAYRAELARRGVDLVARIERAVPALATAPRRAFPLVVCGADRLGPLERELVEALQRAGAEVVFVSAPPVQAAPDTLLRDLLRAEPGTTSRSPDGTFVRVTCRDMLEEAEAAARLTVGHLAAGVPPDRIAIQAPRGAGYGDLLTRVFAEHGLALSATDAIAASATPLYQAFRAFVRLFYLGPDPFDLAAVFGAGGSGVRGGRRDAIIRELLKSMPPAWDGVGEAVVKATYAADPPSPDKPAPPPEQAERHREARTAALAIVEVLVRGPSGRAVADPALAARSLRDAVLWFCGGIGNPHRLLGVVDIPDRDAVGHRDAAAAIRNAATLLVERATAAGGPAAAAFRDATSFLQALEPLLPDLSDDVGTGPIALRFGDDADGRVDHLIVVGFSRGRWPTPAGASPLLGTLEREALRGLGGPLAVLPRPEDVAVLHAQDARAVLAQARRGVVVVTPARGESGADAPPALLLVDLLRRMDEPARLAWRRASEVTFGSAAAAAVFPALGPGLLARATARHALRATARVLGSVEALAPTHRTALVRLAAAGLARPLAARWLPDRTFQLPVPLDVAAREFSASQLEALVSCRYRYFTKYVLGLASLDIVRQPSLSVATTGDIAHHVLEALGERLTTAADDDVRKALVTVLSQRYPWALDTRYRAGVAAIERELLAFVPAYQDTVSGMGWVAGKSEVPFGEKVGKPVTFPLDRDQGEALRAIGTDRLRLQGQVDRVDQVTVKGQPFRLVTDFKFGNVDKYLGHREIGMGLQAALYPSALVQLGGAPPLGFAYFSLTSRRGNLLPSRTAPMPDALGSIAVDDRDLETFQDEVSALLTARLALLMGKSGSGGTGDVTPHSIEEQKRLADAKADSCRYCDAWLLCRFEEPKR
jgi:hypothetical protein